MAKTADRLNRKVYEEKLAELHFELVKMVAAITTRRWLVGVC